MSDLLKNPYVQTGLVGFAAYWIIGKTKEQIPMLFEPSGMPKYRNVNQTTLAVVAAILYYYYFSGRRELMDPLPYSSGY